MKYFSFSRLPVVERSAAGDSDLYAKCPADMKVLIKQPAITLIVHLYTFYQMYICPQFLQLI
jgi:hypothetical protein